MAVDDSTGFQRISAMDSKSLLKPHVPLLVVTESESHSPNVMTAAWWMLAGYEPFRYLLSVDHKTLTYEIIEENREVVLAIPSAGMVDAVALCGSVSGREVDKIGHLDLDLSAPTAVDVPLLTAAVGNIECQVDEYFEFHDNTYYFCEVAAAHVRSGMLDGRILRPEARPLAYMGSDREDGEGKYRFYLEHGDGLSRFPDSAVLPDDSRAESE